MSSPLLFLLLVLLLGSSLPLVLSWGAAAHTAIAFLAQSLFTPNSTALALTLLPSADKGLIDLIASWADEVRITPYHWSAPYHFADTPQWNCTYSPPRDCVNEQCVDGALANYTTRLLNTQLEAEQRMEALMFCVHFVGDSHQPLHVGFKTDLGGNEIPVRFEGVANNLHSLWDTGILAQRVKLNFANNFTHWMVALQSSMNTVYARNRTQWTSCPTSHSTSTAPSHALAAFIPCSGVWVEESAQMACPAYLDDSGQRMNKTSKLTYNLTSIYYNRTIPLIEQRLIQAGVRLAYLINTVTAAIGQGVTVPSTSKHPTPSSPHKPKSTSNHKAKPTTSHTSHVPPHSGDHVDFGVYQPSEDGDGEGGVDDGVDTQHSDQAHVDHEADRLSSRMRAWRL